MRSLSPVEFLQQYRAIDVPLPSVADPRQEMCRRVSVRVQITQYLRMKCVGVGAEATWDTDASSTQQFAFVTQKLRPDRRNHDPRWLREQNAWYEQHRDAIANAAMGKGSPMDYARALEWAVRAQKIADPTARAVQQFADDYLGIECSGLVTNYLIAIGRQPASAHTVRNTSAASYYSPLRAVNDPLAVRRGDLLVWMKGAQPLRSPGHIALVDSFVPASRASGNLRVVEATNARAATPKLLDSWYHVEQIIPAGDRRWRNRVLLLQVKRHGTSGDLVAVIRP